MGGNQTGSLPRGPGQGSQRGCGKAEVSPQNGCPKERQLKPALGASGARPRLAAPGCRQTGNVPFLCLRACGTGTGWVQSPRLSPGPSCRAPAAGAGGGQPPGTGRSAPRWVRMDALSPQHCITPAPAPFRASPRPKGRIWPRGDPRNSTHCCPLSITEHGQVVTHRGGKPGLKPAKLSPPHGRSWGGGSFPSQPDFLRV